MVMLISNATLALDVVAKSMEVGPAVAVAMMAVMLTCSMWYLQRQAYTHPPHAWHYIRNNLATSALP